MLVAYLYRMSRCECAYLGILILYHVSQWANFFNLHICAQWTGVLNACRNSEAELLITKLQFHYISNLSFKPLLTAMHNSTGLRKTFNVTR